MSHDMCITHVRNDCIIVCNDYDVVCAMFSPLQLFVLFNLSIIILGLLVICVYILIILIIN
jgi:hypothetical protein